jgi:uncharacterized membrane protein HdeD (DUF308 family)
MSINPDFSAAQRAVAEAMREHWVLFLVEGIVLVLLGVLAIVIPPLATLAVTILLGWLFLISGVVGLVTTFWAKGAPGFWWSLISAIIAIVAGMILLAWPISGSVSLTLVLIVFFIMEGVASVMYGIEHRRETTGRGGWMIVSGVIDLILAAIIFSGLPGSALWALGHGVRRNIADRDGAGRARLGGQFPRNHSPRRVMSQAPPISARDMSPTLR